MAIQVRRGLYVNLDKNKALEGEVLVSTDKKVVHICFAPGVVKRLATYEDMKADMTESLQEIINNLTVSIKQATDNANAKADLANQKAILADAKAILADQKAQQAQAIIDSTAPVINTNLQATYSNKASNMSGTFITSPTSDDALVHIKKIEGETVQVVTVEGINILPKTKKTVAETYMGITFTLNTDGSITANGTATANSDFYFFGSWSVFSNVFFKVKSGTTYTLKGSGQNNVIFKLITGTSTTDRETTNSSTGAFTFTPTVDKNVIGFYVTVNSGVTVNNLILYPQLVVGSSDIAYSQYTPNSPSVEYPSPLKYAKDFDAMTSTENLLNYSDGTFYPDRNGIKSTINNDGSITLNGTSTSSYTVIYSHQQMKLPKGEYRVDGEVISTVGKMVAQIILTDVNGNNSYYTTNKFVINDSIVRINLQIQTSVDIGVTFNNHVIYPSITVGNIKKTFVKHQSDKINISSFPFMSVPSGVKNSKEYINGVFSDALRVKDIVLNGGVNESWNFRNEGDNSTTVSFTLPKASHGCDTVVNSNDLYCSNYPTNNGSSTDGIEGVAIGAYEFYVEIKRSRLSGYNITMTGAEKVTLFKNWLATNNMHIIYKLNTPIITPTDDIYLKSWKGTTNLLTTSDPQVSMTADVKSELWSRDYLQDEQLKSKFDATSQIEFVEATSDVDIVSGENSPTLWGKTLKSIKTLRSGLALKINKTDIINNDTTGGTDKVASAESLKVLGMETDALKSSIAKYEPTINGNITITEATLDTMMTQGNYAVYFVTGGQFGNGTLWSLKVNKIYYNESGVGYVQEMTKVYPNTGEVQRRVYYTASGWGAWRGSDGMSYLIGAHNLNTYIKSGKYTIGVLDNIANAPTTGTFIVDNCGVYIRQTVVNNAGKICIRISVDTGVTWGQWFMFTGTGI